MPFGERPVRRRLRAAHNRPQSAPISVLLSVVWCLREHRWPHAPGPRRPARPTASTGRGIAPAHVQKALGAFCDPPQEPRCSVQRRLLRSARRQMLLERAGSIAVPHGAACYRGCARPLAQPTEGRRLPQAGAGQGQVPARRGLRALTEAVPQWRAVAITSHRTGESMLASHRR